MKIRSDFVSNSSSSSFICSPEDARRIDLFNQSEILNLHEYLDKFGQQDIFSDLWWCSSYSSKSKIRFVDDCEFSRRFASSIHSILPKSAKKAYDSVDVDFSSKMLFSDVDKLWNAVKHHVEHALAEEWGNSKFEYYEAEDCAVYKSNDSDDSDDYDSDNEESHLIKVFSSRTMAFSRVFSNH